MVKITRIAVVVCCLVILGVTSMAHNTVSAQGPISIRIEIGLGAGTNQDILEVETALLKEWNDAHKDIQVSFDYCNHCVDSERFLTGISAGNPDDIAGLTTLSVFYNLQSMVPGELWADLSPYIQRDKNELQLDDFEDGLMQEFQLKGKQIALPFAIYPSFLYVNKDLFDQAGLELPPTEYGEHGTATYQGKPWDMDTLKELAIKLTRDKNGKYGNEAGFDPEHIDSYGFGDPWTELRGWATHFSPANTGLAADYKTATFNQKAFLEASTFLHDAVFKDHFMPSIQAQHDLQSNGAPFASGKYAMNYGHTWLTCCLSDAKFNWTTAVAPAAPGGKLTARIHLDTFAITESSQHKNAAWEVLKWLNSPEVTERLLAVYGGLPARKSLRAAWKERYVKRQPQYAKLNDDIIQGAIPYMDFPNQDSYLPETRKTWEALNVFWTSLQSDPKFEVAAELERLNLNIQGFFNEKLAQNTEPTAQSSVPKMMVPAQPPKITGIAYSPDGKTILTGRDDGTARLWDAATGKVLNTLTVELDGKINAVSVAYSPDGKTMLMNSIDNKLLLRNVLTGQILETLEGHIGKITSVAFSPDGKMAASASEDKTVQLWDIQHARSIRSFLKHNEVVTDIAFSPNGKLIVTASKDSKVRLWDVASQQLVMTLVGHEDVVTSVQFSPNGTMILSGSDDDTAKLWNIATGTVLITLRGHTDEVFDVAFSPDGKTAMTASCDKTAKLWDIATGKILQTFEGHKDGIRAVAYAPDSKHVVTGSDDRTTRLWDISNATIGQTFPAHIGYIETVSFSPDGKRLLTGGGDTIARLWDIQSGKLLQTFTGHTESIFTAAWSQDGRKIATGGEDASVIVWDVQTGKQLHHMQVQYGNTSAIATLQFSRDGKQIVSISKNFTVNFWSVESGELVRSLYQFGTGVNAAAFSPDGNSVAVGDTQGKFYWRDLRSDKPAVAFDYWQTTDGMERMISSVAFTMDGKHVVTSKDNGTLIFWNLADAASEMMVGTGFDDPSVYRTLAVAILPNRPFNILEGYQDGKIDLRDPEGSFIEQSFWGHTEGVISLAFSPDGSLIASGSMDGTARVWDMKTGKMLWELY